MHLPDPVFPPLLTGHAVKAPTRAFSAAVEQAARGDLGAGDVVWGRSTDRLECAVVLEPEVAPETAAEMIFVVAVAFADAFGSLAPPEIPLTFFWPTTIRLNSARVGEIRAAMSAARDDSGAPHWMVVGVEVEMRHSGKRAVEPGQTPDVTNLEEEGCASITRTELVESFSRHLLAWIHTWEEDGFREVHDSFRYRIDGHQETVTIELAGDRHEGRFTGLDEHGGVLLETPEGMRLLNAMAAVTLVDSAEVAL